MIQELEDVILNCGLPEHRLRRGDIGTVVLVRQAGKGYEVEFATLDGETVAIVTLMVNQVRPSKPREIAHVRDLTAKPIALHLLQRSNEVLVCSRLCQQDF